MKKIIEDVVAAEEAKDQVKEQIKDEEKKTLGTRATKRDPTLKIAGVNDEDLEKVLESLTTTIKVVGCGGAGTNTITRCFGAGINGADLIAVNTDAQHLLLAESPYKILIGRHLTRGLGAGSLKKVNRTSEMRLFLPIWCLSPVVLVVEPEPGVPRWSHKSLGKQVRSPSVL